jgi:putative RecB family exonuclease
MVVEGGSMSGIRAKRISPSAIARFLQCPKRYRAYDLERTAPKPEPSPIFARANAVHHALERFFGLPDEHRSAENLERALRAVWPEHRRGAFRTVDEEIEHGHAAIEMLRRFGQRFDLHAVPLAREQWLTAELPSGVQVFGKVDRIDAVRGGGLEVIDYKTGNVSLEESDLKHEPATWVYVAAAEAAYEDVVHRVRLIYLSVSADIVWDVEREDALELRKRLIRTVNEIEKTTEFPARPGPACNWCAIALRCRERTKVPLEELVPVEGLPFDALDAPTLNLPAGVAPNEGTER